MAQSGHYSLSLYSMEDHNFSYDSWPFFCVQPCQGPWRFIILNMKGEARWYWAVCCHGYKPTSTCSLAGRNYVEILRMNSYVRLHNCKTSFWESWTSPDSVAYAWTWLKFTLPHHLNILSGWIYEIRRGKTRHFGQQEADNLNLCVLHTQKTWEHNAAVFDRQTHCSRSEIRKTCRDVQLPFSTFNTYFQRRAFPHRLFNLSLRKRIISIWRFIF